MPRSLPSFLHRTALVRTGVYPVVTVAVVAAAVVAGCGRVPDPPSQSTGGPVAARAAQPAPLSKPPTAKYQRDFYAKLEDCLADWGLAPKCQPVASDAPERAQGAAFMGPIYSNALRFEAQLATRREAYDQGYVTQVDENPGNRALSAGEVRS